MLRALRDKLHKIEKADFLNLLEEDILFITHPGRMGDEDGSTIITNDGDNYIAYRISGWYMGDCSNPEFISYQDVLKQFPFMDETLHEDGNNEEYKKIYMGFGNLLFVKNSIYQEFQKYLNETVKEYISKQAGNYSEDVAIFNTWDQAVIEMTNDKNIEFV